MIMPALERKSYRGIEREDSDIVRTRQLFGFSCMVQELYTAAIVDSTGGDQQVIWQIIERIGLGHVRELREKEL